MSRKVRDKGRIGGQFVPLLYSTLDSPAWKALSPGARCLYVELKRRHPRERNTSYLSNRLAARELKTSRQKIREWFAELEHYGFIVLAVPGCLGVDGKGKAPHWRLTELGCTSRASADGLLDPPTNDFLKWDGTLFDPKPFRRDSEWAKTESRSTRGDHPGPHVVTTPGCASGPPKALSGQHVVAIERDEGGPHVVAISSLTTTSESAGLSEPPSDPSSAGSLGAQNHVGHFDDPRIIALEAMERRVRAQKRKPKGRRAG
jgi:hypothetical protein